MMTVSVKQTSNHVAMTDAPSEWLPPVAELDMPMQVLEPAPVEGGFLRLLLWPLTRQRL